MLLWRRVTSPTPGNSSYAEKPTHHPSAFWSGMVLRLLGNLLKVYSCPTVGQLLWVSFWGSPCGLLVSLHMVIIISSAGKLEDPSPSLRQHFSPCNFVPPTRRKRTSFLSSAFSCFWGYFCSMSHLFIVRRVLPFYLHKTGPSQSAIKK